jgi:hypothetical protein
MFKNQKSMLTLKAFYGPRDCFAIAFSFFFNNFNVKSSSVWKSSSSSSSVFPYPIQSPSLRRYGAFLKFKQSYFLVSYLFLGYFYYLTLFLGFSFF